MLVVPLLFVGVVVSLLLRDIVCCLLFGDRSVLCCLLFVDVVVWCLVLIWVVCVRLVMFGVCCSVFVVWCLFVAV